MTHTIQKPQLKLTLPTERDAYATQERVGRLFLEEVVPRLDRLFSYFSTDETVIEIQRLEIDVDDLTVQNLDTVFAHRCVEAIEAEIRKQLAERPPSVSERPVSDAHFETFITFLGTGNLSYAPENANWQTILETVEKMIDNTPTAVKNRLMPLFKGNLIAKQRAVAQFSSRFLEKMVEILRGWERGDFLEKLELDIENLLQKPLLKEEKTAICTLLLDFETVLPNDKTALAEVIITKLGLKNAPILEEEKTAIPVLPLDFETVLPNHEKETAANIVTQLELKNAENAPIDSQNLRNAAGNAQSDSSPQNTEGGKISDFEFQISENAQNPKSDSHNSKNTEGGKKTDFETKNEPAKQGNRLDNRLHTADLERGFKVGNAGLVLVAPFLPTYFKTLQLIDNQNFINEEAQKRAALLLHFLATNESEAPEFVHPLTKVLTGLPLETPLSLSIELTVAEKDETETLLKAVIGYWTVLKNTSPDGLREGFFKREGRLRFKGNHWVLQVEKSSIDLLLEHIGWSYSLIKLAWMPQRLHVEWG